MKQIQAFSAQLANRKLAIQMFALALLLFAGLNCGTENPVEETAGLSATEISTGTLHGEVQPIEGALIQIRLLRDGQLLAQTETQGIYELEALEAGNYTLQISAKGHQETEVNVTVVAGQAVTLDKVTLAALDTPVSHLQGILTDVATGAPIPEVHLQLTDKAGKTYEALTTEAGIFTFENLPVEQALTLKIEHADYENTEVAVQPIPASETFELDLKLIPLPEREELDPGEGLSLGSQSPGFELSDGNGKLHTLADYIGNKKVVLVFFRGVW